jgi:hypothetical protein
MAVAIGVTHAAIHSLVGRAEEAVYRMLPFAAQQVTLFRGVLRPEPPAQFVRVVLIPAKGPRDLHYEHRFPSRGAAITNPLQLTVRDVSLYADDGFVRGHPFEHAFKRVLVYWGCGEAVGPGQPLVIDVDSPDDERLGRLLALSPPHAESASVAGHGTVHERFLAHADVHWPEDAQMRGMHELRIGSISTRFSLDRDAEHMPPAAITRVHAPPAGPVRVQWENLQRASAYFANVFVHRRSSRDAVIWTSSSKPEGGWLLHQTHLAMEELEQLRAAGVLLPPGTEQCVVPEAVRRHTNGAMVFQLHAYAAEVTVRGRSVGSQQSTVMRIAAKSTTSLLLQDSEGTGFQASAEVPARRSKHSATAPAAM